MVGQLHAIELMRAVAVVLYERSLGPGCTDRLFVGVHVEAVTTEVAGWAIHGQVEAARVITLGVEVGRP